MAEGRNVEEMTLREIMRDPVYDLGDPKNIFWFLLRVGDEMDDLRAQFTQREALINSTEHWVNSKIHRMPQIFTLAPRLWKFLNEQFPLSSAGDGKVVSEACSLLRRAQNGAGAWERERVFKRFIQFAGFMALHQHFLIEAPAAQGSLSQVRRSC